MRRDARTLRHDGDIGIGERITRCANQFEAGTQQRAAVGTAVTRIGVGEMASDITRRDGPEQGIAQGV